jgi:hypothetical protein
VRASFCVPTFVFVFVFVFVFGFVFIFNFIPDPSMRVPIIIAIPVTDHYILR